MHKWVQGRFFDSVETRTWTEAEKKKANELDSYNILEGNCFIARLNSPEEAKKAVDEYNKIFNKLVNFKKKIILM